MFSFLKNTKTLQQMQNFSHGVFLVAIPGGNAVSGGTELQEGAD